MTHLKNLALVVAAFAGLSVNANAGSFPGNDSDLTLIWVTIKAHPGEGLWQACRRVYQRDVYKVRGSYGHNVRCKIDHSRVYDYGERRQNFNQY